MGIGDVVRWSIRERQLPYYEEFCGQIRNLGFAPRTVIKYL